MKNKENMKFRNKRSFLSFKNYDFDMLYDFLCCSFAFKIKTCRAYFVVLKMLYITQNIQEAIKMGAIIIK
jgi:hypothetical protein